MLLSVRYYYIGIDEVKSANPQPHPLPNHRIILNNIKHIGCILTYKLSRYMYTVDIEWSMLLDHTAIAICSVATLINITNEDVDVFWSLTSAKHDKTHYILVGQVFDLYMTCNNVYF